MRWHLNTSERKWRQPQLQLHLITKFRGRRELGLLTSSDATYDVLSYANVLWTANLLNTSTFFVHETFLLYSSARFIARELQSVYSIISFGFVGALISGYAVRIFCTINAKYVTFRVGWRKSLEGSANPDNSHYCTDSNTSGYFFGPMIDSTNLKLYKNSP